MSTLKTVKTLMKETKDTNKWKYIPCPWTSRMNTVKMFLLPKGSYRRLNAIPVKIPMILSKEIEQTIRKFVCNHKTLNSQSNLEKAEQSWRQHAP